MDYAEDRALIDVCLNCPFVRCAGQCARYDAARRRRGKKQMGRPGKLYELNGVRRPLSEWAAALGITVNALDKRLKGGMTFAQAVAYPTKWHGGRAYEAFGESRTLREWAEHVGIPLTTLKSRLYAGWDIERALYASDQRRRGK